jgi:arylsulfatase A-like enzyme
MNPLHAPADISPGVEGVFWAMLAESMLMRLPCFAALATLLLLGCFHSGNTPPPNIVLITVDTLRADRLNPYGYTAIETPAISRLAEEGILFEQAFTDVTWTVPAMSSVMTGQYPTVHGVRTWDDYLPEEQTTLAELLNGHGYKTVAIVGSYALDRRFGLSQGFEKYDDAMSTPLMLRGKGEADEQDRLARSSNKQATWQQTRMYNDAYRPDDQVADRAIACLDSPQGSPFFLWVHFFGPHEKGMPPIDASPEQRKAVAARQVLQYDPDVRFADQQVGRLLDRIRQDRRARDTVIVFHSDHGQSLEEHGLVGHGFDLFDSTAHVPLIIRLTRQQRAGERVSALVRNLDIFATVLHLAGAGVPAAVASRDLLSSEAKQDAEIYLETYHFLGLSARDVAVDGKSVRAGTILKGIRTSDWKLISQQLELTRPQGGMQRLPRDLVASRRIDTLYHLPEDPGEQRDRAADRPDLLEQMRRTLEKYAAHEPDRHSSNMELDDTSKERLRRLGYTQ